VKIKPDLIVLDETQKIKNDKAIRSKAALHICSNIQHVIGLTGTPIKNRPIEIFTLIKAINKHIFPSKRTFGEKFCGLTYNGWGWDYSGATNLDELHRILCNTIMIRRKKEEVLPELPPKVRTVVPLDITNRSEYERAEDDLIAYIRSLKGDTAAAKASRAEHLVRFENLKQIAVKGKINACVEWIHDFLETENKIVTFSIHKFTREILKKDFNKEYVLLDGSVSAIDRQKAVDAFQNNEAIKVFIGDLIAAGEAITLTAASSTCFLELGWTPGDHDQAEDRVHRIGQKADSINAYYLIARNTIEEKLCAMIDQKRQVISQAIDGKKAEDIDLLTELIKFYGGE
jgi:SWI/SNF-related matrix-associated actin-dependent regulator 1 of chromatin subfamily A